MQTRDNATKEEKLHQLSAWEKEIHWKEVKPDLHNDWFHQRNEDFKRLIPIYEKEGKKFEQKANSIFTAMSAGLKTGSDPWLYNFSKKELLKNIATITSFYDKERKRWEESGKPRDVKDFVKRDETKIHWTRELLNRLVRNQKIEGANQVFIRTALYRPFVKANLYYDPNLIEMTYQIPSLFPIGKENKCILISEGNSTFDALITDIMPDLHVLNPSDQILPLYWYGEGKKGSLLNGGGEERHSAISLKVLDLFKNVYKDPSISPKDIFYYVYGILNSEEYREKWKNDFIHNLPHIPLSRNFEEFKRIGKALGELHINYESADPYSGAKVICEGEDLGSVKKMHWDKKNPGTLHISDKLSITNIPQGVNLWRIGNKSPIEWWLNPCPKLVANSKKVGIVNNPYALGARYIKDLVLRLITVSLESQKLINSLPEIDEVESVDYKQIWKDMTL